ncbi:TetR/AcrR family transcriptional regulator [Lichenibacterium ramalinae]|uniref:TetR/AcrR family transcriptional regulator n=1 Tax=Lichenibacterium ramalinae TaxID=2316527 RepID=A0A4Q2R6T1_9HYPH|nr:TetR/AcrR family transcriptional regulator [Lichenibacterium ramalinae]
MSAKSSRSPAATCMEPGPVPRGARRRDAIVGVAEGVFLAQGFTETTMRDIAARAGASKETLYRHFGSKEGLFAEVVSNRARMLRGRLDADLERPNALPAVLRDFGINLLEAMTSPEVSALLRLVVAEAPRDPAIGRIFYALGPERTRERLTELLEAARSRGEFLGDKPGLAASIFLGAVTSQAHTARLVLQDPPPMGRDEIEERVTEVVAMFLLRYGRPAAG